VFRTLGDPVFSAPFAPYFHPVIGRPSTPAECYLRLMFLKFRYRLGFESLCAEVSALLAAEREAPEEIHARPAVRDLVSGLLVTGRTNPELRGLATRCRIT
jgi:hypothetical protein